MTDRHDDPFPGFDDYIAMDDEARFEPIGHAAPSASAPRWISARDLCAMEFEPIKYVVPDYIAEGLTLFAGRPKLGKSWFCLEAALAVAGGGTCLGNIPCEQGDVLYLGLEDNRRRLKSRINKLWELETQDRIPVPHRLHLATEWPRANEGGIEAIRGWIRAHPGARLVVVDVLAMFRPTSKGRDQSAYDSDYLAIKALQAVAMETGVAIVVVHHTRKSGAEADPFEKVSGTLGLSGAADTTLILDRDGNGATLYGRGRDIEEIESAIIFDKPRCRWVIQGEASEIRRTDERGAILAVLDDADEPMNPREIAIEANMKRNNVDRLLGKMVKAGEVMKAGRGMYVHSSRSDLLTADAKATPGKNGKKVRNEPSDPAATEGVTADGLSAVLTAADPTGKKPEETESPAVEETKPSDRPHLTVLTVLTGDEDHKDGEEQADPVIAVTGVIGGDAVIDPEPDYDDVRSLVAKWREGLCPDGESADA